MEVFGPIIFIVELIYIESETSKHSNLAQLDKNIGTLHIHHFFWRPNYSNNKAKSEIKSYLGVREKIKKWKNEESHSTECVIILDINYNKKNNYIND